MKRAEFERTFNLPFKEAEAWFRQKTNVPTARWDDLSGAAHVRSFASAGAMQADLLNDLRRMTDAAIAGDMDIREFRRQFRPLVEKYGWQLQGGGPSWRSDLIFRTNIQSAYQAGRWQQLQGAGVEYLSYVHNDAVRHPRPTHLAMDGTVLPITDHFWSVCYPPNGFGCKCKAVPATKEEIGAAGDVPRRPAEWESLPDQGWNYNVGQNVGRTGELQQDAILGQKIAGLPGDLATALLAKLRPKLGPITDASFSQWIDALLGDGNRAASGQLKTTGELHPLWYVTPEIAAALAQVTNTPLQNSLITISDRQALHSLHLDDVASAIGRAAARIITVDDLKRLPRHLREPQAVLYDTSPKSKGLIYVFTANNADNRGKWAVRINVQEKSQRMTTNAVQSGAYVDLPSLQGKQYILLQGSL